MPVDLKEKIRDKDGKVIRQSRNLAGIRRYVSGWNAPIINAMAVDEIAGGEGKLMMMFKDGSNYETNFASFAVLCGFVRNWRNVYGAPLMVNGEDAGTVGYKNEKLAKHAR